MSQQEKKQKKSLKYKALICDVDGTLVPNTRYGKPSENVTKAVEKASKVIHVGIATSRPYFMLDYIFDHLRLSGPSVISCGAQIIDGETRKIIWEKPLEKNDFLAVCNAFKNSSTKLIINNGGKEYIYDFSKPRVPHRPLVIVIVGLDIKEADKITNTLSIIPTIAIHKSPDWTKDKVAILITHALATKQHGIWEIAKILNVSTHEIIGVGDGHNDLPLLLACGLKVAMGNAVPAIKEIADYIAPSVDEDGVADVIEKFVLTK